MTRRSKNPYARPDARTRAAKARGFPARSVFKLEEIDRRVRLLHGGQHVLDLGAAPGSWSMYAASKVGPSGRVVAVDIQEIPGTLGSNVIVVRGDALSAEPPAEVTRLAPYDVVLSDMAPATSGAKITDRVRSFELLMKALDMALSLGKPGAFFVGKIFMSEDFPMAQKAVKAAFEECRVIRPEGTRSTSTEVFLIGQRLRKAQKPTV